MSVQAYCFATLAMQLEVRENFRHSVSLLSFNEVCEIIAQLAMHAVASLLLFVLVYIAF